MNAANTEDGKPAVELAEIVKRFGRVTALDGASFSADAGAVSALVGENGAGKTTLMRILAGRLRPDAGKLVIEGSETRISSPRDAARRGIAMVEQDCRLIAGLTVLENVLLAAPRFGTGRPARREAGRRLNEILKRLRAGAAADTPAETLSASQRQRAAIAGALFWGASTLILDEPTSLLGPSERTALFDIMRDLAAGGAALIFITHKLAEVFEVAERVTVLRRGRTVWHGTTSETSADELARAMVGGADLPVTGEATSPAPPARPAEPGETVLALDKVSTDGAGRDSLKQISLELRRGEITGIAGIAGNGQRALADVAAGLRAPTAGRVRRVPGATVAAISEDVDAMDLVGSMRLWENAILGDEDRHARFGRLDAGSAHRAAEGLVTSFGITGDADAPARFLSGGNRQRLVVAREVSRTADVIIAEEPARGLDISAAQLAANVLAQAAADGAAVLLISYDLDDLYRLADRILVLASGRLIEPSTQPPQRADLGRLMAG
ncbi:MAG: ABC transporter ATP-binding protein [Planctomycetota bacterium]|jgi:simple sugar transport system ATP-binding protein